MFVKYAVVILASFLLGLVSLIFLKGYVLRKKLLLLQGIPLIGGISTGLAFSLTCLYSFFLSKGSLTGLLGIVGASLLMLIFGVVDDSRELSISAKFLVQIIATTLLILFGIRTQIVNIGTPLNIIITFLWVIGITNAFNHLDVIDGLAGGTALIIGLSFFTISILNNDIRTAIMALALIGAVMSFLVFNLPPAKVYLGNAGSHYLGFVLAALALIISYAPLERKVALFSPLLILGLPIFDSAFLILMRLKEKRSIFKKSDDHLALRFIKLGYTKQKALLFMPILCLFFCLLGIAVSQATNLFGLILVIIAIVVSLAITNKMGKVKIDA